MKEKITELFRGEYTLSKREFWIIIAACTLFGIVVGLFKAPLTHGVTIGSNNGNTTDSFINTEEDDNCENEGCC